MFKNRRSSIYINSTDKLTRTVIALVLTVLLIACSSTKHVPDGSYLLDKVSIKIEGDSVASEKDLYYFLRQTPNHKVLGFAKLQLATYSLSGADSTKWYNRWLRNIGQEPVIYSPELTDASVKQLRQALVNRGYLDTKVIADTISDGKKKIHVVYDIIPGAPHYISSISYEIPDTSIRKIVLTDTFALNLRPGIPFDRNTLDNDRAALTERLRNAGYYAFSKENITFVADTTEGSKAVELTMNIRSPRNIGSSQTAVTSSQLPPHLIYRIRDIYFITDPDHNSTSGCDTIDYHSIHIIYGKDRYIKPGILEEKCYLRPGAKYSATNIDRTYEALGQLGILKFINIEMQPVAEINNEIWLDALIRISRNRKQGISVEIEGTNSEGDLGFGAGITYQHRNLAKNSELLTAKFRGAYESLSGDFDGLINDRYTEIAGEVGITFPKFEFPFLSKSFKQRQRASTEFALSFVHQERPEYTRIIAGAAWRYKWSRRDRDIMRRHTFDLIDVNYVRLPRSTINFIDQIAPSNPLLRYSYEDHFIMRTGYTYSRTNKRIPTSSANAFTIQPSVTTLRASGELAGNILYAISSIDGAHRHDGAYKIFGIQFAQYVKGEIDYTFTRNFNSRNALACHAGFGIAYPYGNSSMVPFEKRFYAGGANSVRGWSVRSLGPGAYDSKNSVADFINQCGDISLDLSVEYRAKLFWVFESALFVDAGNIWTIHRYENQPDGEFRFNKFYKQIAAAYGVGLRMDFTYFLLRFDLGFKAINPAVNQERWPILHPRWSRDANFHFSVGYPF